MAKKQSASTSKRKARVHHQPRSEAEPVLPAQHETPSNHTTTPLIPALTSRGAIILLIILLLAIAFGIVLFIRANSIAQKIARLEERIQEHPMEPAYYFDLAAILEEIGREKDAERYRQKGRVFQKRNEFKERVKNERERANENEDTKEKPPPPPTDTKPERKIASVPSTRKKRDTGEDDEPKNEDTSPQEKERAPQKAPSAPPPRKPYSTPHAYPTVSYTPEDDGVVDTPLVDDKNDTEPKVETSPAIPKTNESDRDGGRDEKKDDGNELDAAKRLVTAGKQNDAKRKLHDLLKRDANNADAYFLLGTIYEQEGNIDSAIDHYEKARNTGGDGTAVREKLAPLYYAKGKTAYKGERYDEAETHFTKCLAFDEGNVKARYNLALTYLKRGKQENALTTFTDVTARAKGSNPKVASYAEKQRGTIFFKQKAYAKAIAAYEQANALLPSAEVYASISVCYEHLGKRDEARKAIEKALSLDPSDAHARLLAADIFFALVKDERSRKRPREAIALGQKAITYNKNHIGLYNELGLAHMDLKEYESAVVAFERAIALGAGNAVRLNLAVSYSEQHAVEKAIETLTTLLASDEDHVEAHYLIAHLYYDKGEKTNALSHFKIVLALAPDHPKKATIEQSIAAIEREL